jgi:hypothetical protein
MEEDMSEEELARLRAEHGDLIVVKAKGQTLVFKTPSDTAWEEFQDKISTAKVPKGASFREVCLRSLVSPTRDEAAAVFVLQPALPAKIADKLADLAGAEAEIEVKKG